MKQQITEKMGIHKEWYEEAKRQTVETLPAFINKLITEYEHDYGTICHAIAAAAIGAAWAVDHSPTGGITGFQAGCIMWSFVRNWSKESNKTGLKLVDYDHMLYPQYGHRFEKIISSETWEAIQSEAQRILDESGDGITSIIVKKHLESIVAGVVPFGYEVIDK